MEVSKLKAKSGDILENLRLAFAGDKERLVEAFDKIHPFDFDENPEETLKTLADLSTSGGDQSGEIIVDKKPVVFSVNQVLDNLILRRKIVCKSIDDKNLVLVP